VFSVYFIRTTVYSNKKYRLGDKVKIKVKKILLARKQIDFVFV